MLTTSKDANPNYLCKVFQIHELRKHSNADRLQMLEIDFNTVITGMDAKEGDVYVYFPVECKINKDFLSHTNSFRDYTLNATYLNAGEKEKLFFDDNKSARIVGFFEDKCRVKAMKLRGEKSMGYIVPASTVFGWVYPADYITDYRKFVGQEFDTIADKLLVEKYVVKTREPRNKQGKEPKVSRLIDGQIHLHVDTENLRRNAEKIKPQDWISITYKTHGTSWWVSNVMVQKKLNWFEKLLKRWGFNIVDTEYDLIYGSRRVVKNKSMEDPKQQDHFYGYDLWEDIKNEVGENLPKGYTLYGECLGFDKNGGAIQKGYDYGCTGNEHKLEVYRITHTNPDGVVTELDYPQMVQFCNKLGLNTPFLYFWGKAGDWYAENKKEKLGDPVWVDDRDFPEVFVKALERTYNEKDCFMCVNKVPEEGIVVRKESLFDCESYKLKSFNFLEWESKELDKGESDIESDN